MNFQSFQAITKKTNNLINYYWSKYKVLSGISVSDNDLRSSFNIDFISTQEVARYFKCHHSAPFFIDVQKKESYVKTIKELYPKSIDKTLKDAESVINHCFDLLGSGPKNLGDKINWHRDFKSGYQWPEVYYKDIYYKDYNKNYDVKIPRELSRFQYVVPLGKAYWYTGDERYAEEFVSLVSDWINENQPGIGVNWECTMDVAIRIVNWIWGFYFFKDSEALTEEFIIHLLKSLLIHGRHIRWNLEYNESFTTNHYISDLVGLFFLAYIFPEFKASEKWYIFCTEELLNELNKQVYKDGMHYEASTSYHRLVLELYYSTALLARLNNYEWPEWAWSKIYKMFEFVKGVIKPNGKIPQIGDNDSGRLQILEQREDLEHLYLLPIAALLFNDPSFKLKDVPFPEEALWLFGPQGYELYKSLPAGDSLDNLSSHKFENCGLYTIRSQGNYCIISCGPKGQNGNGGHSHNDTLSFELNIRGTDIIIDPGTYIYTGDYAMRNLFRSTSYHNTIKVDQGEINDFDQQKLFQLKDRYRTKINFFGCGNFKYRFIGEHTGYHRLEHPVTHRREIVYDEITRYWGIHDLLDGDKGCCHCFEQYFHFAPNYDIKKRGTQQRKNFLKYNDLFSYKNNIFQIDLIWHIYRIKKDNMTLFFCFGSDQNIDVSLRDGWISKRYGSKETAPMIVVSFMSECPVNLYTLITQ